MFNSFKKSFALGALMALAISGQAMAGGFTTDGKITYVKTGGDNVIVDMAGAVTDNPDGCTTWPYPSLYILTASSTHYTEMLSTIMTAAASNSDIRFWVSGCVADFGGVYPKITSATLLTGN